MRMAMKRGIYMNIELQDKATTEDHVLMIEDF